MKKMRALLQGLLGLIALVALIGYCAFGQISCQNRLHAQGVPFGDDRMEVCFSP